MEKLTLEETKAISDCYFLETHSDPHQALADRLEITRDEAKLRFYQMCFRNKTVHRLMIEPHQELWKAVRNLYKAKGRFHTEQATRKLFEVAEMHKVKK